jgi:deazaflavin-dependent oxidoreductase (nitroreductase family)
MWFNPIMASLLRSPFHALISNNMMLITVRGRRTGRALTTPVNYVRQEEALLVVSFRARTWWRNLRGGAPVELLLAGKQREAVASVAETDSEVVRGLAEIVRLLPSHARPLGIGLDGPGRPKSDDLARAAQSHVIIRLQMKPCSS